MMQKIIMIGRVGKEVEFIKTESNTLAKFPLAVSEKWKDKQGNKQESTEWFNIEIWGKLSEVAQKYVNKGDLLFLEGKSKTETYEKDGIKRYATKIIVNQMTMLGSKDKSNKPQEKVDNSMEATDNQEDTDDLPF